MRIAILSLSVLFALAVVVELAEERSGKPKVGMFDGLLLRVIA